MHDTNLFEDQPIAWTPTPEVIECAQLTKFMRQVGVSTWDELYEFSIRDVEKFTEEVIKFLDIKFDPPYEKLFDLSNGVEFPTWLAAKDAPPRRRDAENTQAETRAVASVPLSEPGAVATGFPSHAGLNITEMCLDRWQTHLGGRAAIVWEGEDGTTLRTSYTVLLREVEYAARGLKALGFVKGDAIGIHLPMMIETVIALLAISRIGAIAVPVFSGYGVEAIASRLNAVGAKGLFTCDGFPRRGKFFDAFGVSVEAVNACQTISKVFIANRGHSINNLSDRTDDERFIEFEELITWGENPKDDPLEKTSAEDPLIILYTSGTTGKPKGIAHTHASFPIKAAQDMAFGTDVGKGTRICWYTDIGWMMGPWLIYGALINGATICIYDGAPDYPTPDRMWEFCARHKVEILGISPTLVRALAACEDTTGSPPYEGGVAAASADGVVLSLDDSKAENHPPAKAVPLLRKEGSYKPPYQRHDLSSLRAFASTGEPWNPAPWWWLFEKVGDSKLPIINYSGGTEIAGGILMGNPLLPQKPCSFPAPCPGMDVDILDENGEPVGPNEVGELVIKQPWIGMARGFWQEKERYLETYWRRFKNVWVHGDWAMRDADGHWFILGRSDDTLKVAGKRVGPAEVESLLVAHALVTEAAVIGVPDEAKGTAMVAFCVLTKSSPPYTTPSTKRGHPSSDKEGSRAADASSDGVVLSDSVSSVHSVVNLSEDTETTENTESTEQIQDESETLALQSELKSLVALDMGKPLAPSKIHFVSALPKTRNAKVMRRVIRSAYLGEDPGDLSALENPAVVDELRNIGR